MSQDNGKKACKTLIATFVLTLFLALPLGPIFLGSGDLAQESSSSDAQPWWKTWSYDTNHNRVDDRVEEKLEADPTARIPIFVDYVHPPGMKEQERIENLGFKVSYIAKSVDTIFVESVLPSEVPRFLELPGVVMVELNPPIHRQLDISCPATKSRPSVYYSDNAWDLGYTGDGIVIAVLDTGVDDQHESLNGKFVAGVDVSNAGFNVEGNPDDGNGHGTHCAGIAMGNGGNTDDSGDGEPDYMGTAPDAQLVDVKIGTDVGGNVGGAIIRGIDWCIDNKDQYDIRVLSISFGSTGSSDGQDATSRAANNGVDEGLVIVAAAGNDGPNNNGFGSPAAADKVITIGAVDENVTISRDDDVIDNYSNRGPRSDDGDDDQKDELKPDLTAPGTTIHSCQHSSVGQVGVGYTDKTGTSMACPHISGIVALMLEANPNLTPKEVKTMLRQSAEQRGAPYDRNLSSRYSREYGWGIVDAYNAVRLALGGEVPTQIDIVIKTPSPTEELKNKTYINASVDINQGVVEKIELFINNKRYLSETDTDSISYLWNTRNVRNGEYTINVTATGNSETESLEIAVFVNNTGGGPSDDEGEWFEELDENLVYGLIGVTGIVVIALLGIFIKKRRNDDDDDDDDDDDGDDFSREKGKKKKKRATQTTKKATSSREARDDDSQEHRKKSQTRLCDSCKNELSFIPQYDAWYCYDCEEYAD